MDIDKFKHQHTKILAGISGNAQEISSLIVSMSSIIRLRPAVEAM